MVVFEAEVRFVETRHGRFGEVGTYVDEGDHDEDEDHEKHPWLLGRLGQRMVGRFRRGQERVVFFD